MTKLEFYKLENQLADINKLVREIKSLENALNTYKEKNNGRLFLRSGSLLNGNLGTTEENLIIKKYNDLLADELKQLILKKKELLYQAIETLHSNNWNPF